MGDIENQGVTLREMFEGQVHLKKGVIKILSSMSLKCAVELGIADVIHSHGRPITLSELASALNIQPTKTRSLFHFMRLFVHVGLFSKTKVVNHNEQEEAYGLTPTSTLLIKDNSYCLSPLVTGLLDQDFVSSFQYLSSWFKANDLTLWETVRGLKFWDYLSQNPGLSQQFNQVIESDSVMATLLVKDCRPIFQGLRSMVDVGGGTGAFARIISEAFPGIKCTVLDLPHAVTDMPQTTVFHFFDDEDCLKLLKKCREAIASNGERGKVLIIDIVIDEKEDDRELTESKLLFDIFMNFNVGGKERTEQEWGSLFVNAGFTDYKIAPIFGIKSLIEVYPLVSAVFTLLINSVEKKDAGVAITVITSNISAATFLSTVSLTLSSLIGAWLGSSTNNIFESELILGDTRASTISIKYISLLSCFLLAFSCFVQSTRHFVHATYLISMPEDNVPVKYAEIAIIKGGEFWSLGLRALYFALNLLLWFFGPIPMFLSSIILVIILHYLDTNTTPLHNYSTSESCTDQKVADRIYGKATFIDHNNNRGCGLR
ncbi:hypothetical protein WN943_012501 [Citrus x changshan-huyou]